MSRYRIKKQKRIRKIAAGLALVLALSELPVMQLAAAPAQITEQTVNEPGEGTTEGTDTGSDSGAGTGGTDTGSGSGAGTGGIDTGSGSEGGTGDTGTENGNEGGTEGTGSENGNEADAGDETEENGEDEIVTDEEDEETDSEIEEDEEIEEQDSDEKEDGKLQNEDEDLLTDEEIAAQKAMVPKNMPVMEVYELPEHYVASANYSYRTMGVGETLPSEYDSRDSGFLTSVKNQNPWGTCWAFSTLCIMEASLIRQGIASRDEIDLSERHLAYFTYNTGGDKLDNASGDTITSSDSYYLNTGGNIYRASMRLMNWQGAAAENSYPYSYSSQVPASLDTESAQDDVYHMKDCYFLDTKANDAETIRNVKTLVKQYGCAMWSYYHSDSYYNFNTKAYYNNAYAKTNHAIVIVGWDDDYPKENFNTTPNADGAWIVRNSWGDEWGEDGYFYISYEDVSLGCGNGASVMIADTADNYDNNYFYSNAISYDWRGYYGKVAQVYQVKGISAGKEQLKAVSLMLGSTNTNYEIQIYKNPELVDGVVQNPESGTAMLDSRVTGSTSYAGVYTIDLPTPVTFEADDYMAVVIYFPDRDGLVYSDMSGEEDTLSYYNETNSGESFYSSYTTEGNWNDLKSSSTSLRINLLTDNFDDGEVITQPVVSATVTQPSSFSDTYKINLRWNKCTGVSGYEIYRSNSESGSYEQIASTDNTKRQYQDEIAQTDEVENYYYKVRAVFSDGNYQDSEPVKLALENVIEIKGFKLSFDGKAAQLTWNAVAGASGYEIQRKEEGDAEYVTLINISDISVTSYLDDLSEMQQGFYLYRIRAYNAAGKYTAWSQEETAAMDLKITPTDYETVQFAWPPIDNAAWYYIFIRIGNAYYGSGYRATSVKINMNQWFQNIKNYYPSENIPDFRVGDTYTCYLKAVDSSGTQLYQSSTASFRTVPDELVIDSAELTEENTVRLAWSNGQGADRVEIYRSESPDQYGEVYAQAPIEDGSYTDNDVTVGATYYYWVCPTVQNSANVTVSGNMTGYKMIEIPFLTQNTVLESAQALSDTEVTLSWKENAQADGYYVYRSDAAGTDGTLLTAVTGKDILSYRDTGLNAGNVYYYSIAAYAEENGEKHVGKVSAQKGVRTLPAKTEIGESVTLSDTGAEIAWKQTAGADGYIIERRVGEGAYEQLTDITGSSIAVYEDTAVLSGNTYTYRIKAYNKALDGSLQYGQVSDEKQVAVTVGAVNNLTAVYNNGIVEISWDRIARAKAYSLYVKQNSGAYTKLGTVTENSYFYKEAKAGNIYTFKVVVVTQTDAETPQESVCELILYPETVSVSMISAVSEKKLCISWNGTDGIAYDIYRGEKDTEEFMLLCADYMGDSYEDEDIITGKTYYYKVVACENGLKSNLSDTVSKSGFSKPDKAVLVSADYDKIVIRNNPDFEYAIGTVYGNVSGWDYISGEGETLTFDGLAENSKYYIFVRTKEEITEEEPVYGAELTVSTNVKAQLALSPSNVVVSKGNRVAVTATVTPGNIHYPELSWSAKDMSGNNCETETVGDTVIVKGSDGKEILRVADGKIYAVGESEEKEVYLWAAKGTMKAGIKVLVNVPVTGLSIRVLGETEGQAGNLESLQIGDQINVGVDYAPANADDTTVYWTSSNSKVATVTGQDASSVTVTAQGVGDCVLRAYTADGVSTEKRISVNKAENIYGIWVSDTSLDQMQVTADKNGNFSAEGLQAKPVYELQTEEDGTENASVILNAYLLKESGIQKQGDIVTGGILQKAGEGEIVYRCANISVATVDTQGKVVAVGAGETDLFAYDTNGNEIYGSCHIIVSGTKAPEETGTVYPIDKSYKISAVVAKQNLQTYANDSKSSILLQVKNQYGTLLDADLFTFVSANPSVCMVDEEGVVRPNPDFTAAKNTSVKITAALKKDPSKRKVTFTVTVLAANQIDRMVIEKVADDGTTEEAEKIVSRQFVKEDKITFAVKAYDAAQKQIGNPSVKFSVSDTSVATAKVNKDKTVTLTLKKAGRVNLICTAQDSFKKTTSVQIAAVSTAPVISATQVNVNKMTAKQDVGYRSDSFLVTAPNGAAQSTPEITEVKAGKKILTSDTGLENFHVVENGDDSYSIGIFDTGGFVGTIKNNTVYTVTMQTEISGIPGIENTVETFNMKVKVISKEPAIKVTVPSINRFFILDQDVTGLLVINAASTVTDVSVLTGNDQINGFDRYFVSEKKNGQWYLRFRDDTGKYNKTSIKGKIAFTVDGYAPVIKTITVKTPVKKQSVKQQAVPSIHTTVSKQAEIVLYNNTAKETINSLRIVSVDSKTLDVSAENDGTLQVVIKEGASYKNGATLTATVKVMETENGEDCWKEPISLKISAKVFSSKNPTVTMKNTTLTLNTQLVQETAKTAFSLNYQNVKLKDVSDWQLYAYNKKTKKYDLQETATDWLTLSYDKDAKMLVAGFTDGESGTVADGSYKFRISGFAEGFDTLYKDFTVKVIRTQPTITVKVSGKLDLVNRSAVTLSGKVTLKNSSSTIKAVTILDENGEGENPYYRATEVVNGTFKIVLTEEGMTAPLTTAKKVLPIRVELENGFVINNLKGITFKPVQTTPKVTVPATQTIYKSIDNLTRDYDMTKKLAKGTNIKRIDVDNAPNGFGVITKEGHVLVTLSDRGVKAGSYKIKIKIYFEGEEAVAGYPDGKPLSKTITVKVTE